MNFLCYTEFMKENTINFDLELENKERKIHLLDEFDETQKEEIISVKLEKYEDFFNSFDPSPDPKRKLNLNVVEYLIDQLTDLENSSRITVNIYVPDLSENESSVIKDAFENYFKNEAIGNIRHNKKSMNYWRKYLRFGSLVMIFICFISKMLEIAHFSDVSFFRAFTESFFILGWVILWEPADYLFFERRKEKYILIKYMRLHRAKINVINQVSN